MNIGYGSHPAGKNVRKKLAILVFLLEMPKYTPTGVKRGIAWGPAKSIACPAKNRKKS